MEINQLYPSHIIHLFSKRAVGSWMERTPRRFKKGEQIYFPDKCLEEIYLLKEGTVRVFHVHQHGKECVLGLMSAGDFIDLASVFSESDSNLYAIALTDVTAVQVTKSEIREQVRQTPDLSMALLHYFSNKLSETVRILEQVAYEKVEERLLNRLRHLAEPDKEENGWLPLPDFLTHRDLAGMIASTRETVTFLLNKFIGSGEIRYKGKKIWIQPEKMD